jgi:hypothetical protein
MHSLSRASGELQFCAIEYRPQELEKAPSLENVIILLSFSPQRTLDVRVHPAWRRIVGRDHQEYVREVISDFRLRSRIDSESLIKQAAELSVGPLVTYARGADLYGNPDIVSLSEWFIGN